jgi:predicted dehydrogenase
MLNVALIGLGNIALLFDTNKANQDSALSHVKAIYLHEDFNLVYGIDINLDNEKIVRNFFPKCELFTSHLELTEKNNIDVVVIATPTINHFSILKDLKINKNIKIFFVEKPLFELSEDYKSIPSNIKNKIVINYLRRFTPAFIDLKKRLSSENLIEKIVINYCKGIKNNGSHLIDLLNYFFDDLAIKSCQILSSSIGFDKNDLCYDLYILVSYKNQTFPIFFISHNHQKYNLINMDIYTKSQHIKFSNSKGTITYHKIINDVNFPTYKVFDDIPEEIEINNKYLMYYAYEKISRILTKNEENISSFDDEIKNKNFLKYILKD